MTRPPRLYHPTSQSAEELVLEGNDFHYLVHVLRLRPGAAVVIFGSGLDREYRLVGVGADRATLRFLRGIDHPREPEREILLAIAVGKGKTLEEIVESTTALGVTSILPFTSDHSVARRSNPRLAERLDLLATQACRQCGRSTVPAISTVLPSLDSVFSALPGSTTLVYLNEQGGEDLLSTAGAIPTATPVALFVGPEGGWSDRERELFHDRGASPASLGPRILRTELAATVAVAFMERMLPTTS